MSSHPNRLARVGKAAAMSSGGMDASPSFWLRAGRFSLWLLLAVLGADSRTALAQSPTTPGREPVRFEVRGYELRYDPLIFSNAPVPILSAYAGTNLGPERLAQAAANVLVQFQERGYPNAYISINADQVTNGLVKMYVYKGASPQILISGRPWLRPGDSLADLAKAPPPATTTTNAEPHFTVEAYEITGNTLLSSNTLVTIFARGVGTNVTVGDITRSAGDLQKEYRDRGYPTVNVTIPKQDITNATVKIRVFEGILTDIIVSKNRYFSSNNVMRALPGLHTNTLLSGPVLQAEVDRANANQDRQIYPQIEPGPEPSTSILKLGVKDRLPLHAKVELNSQNSPGTPNLRLNSSVMYNNFWQLEHSAGLQYSFSPEEYKDGPGNNFYDLPRVVNYGGFYRMPLGDYGPVDADIARDRGKFGYDEATRKFRLPTPSGRPELNIYGSRSTIDTSLLTLSSTVRYSTNGNTLQETDVQQDLTVNNGFGARISLPIANPGRYQSSFSGGFDYKSYQLISSKTNIFKLTSEIIDTISNPARPTTNINVSVIDSPVPTTFRKLDYVPLAVRYDGSLRDSRGVTAFGLGISVNPYYSGSVSELRGITGSQKSSGNWVIANPSLIREIVWHTNWNLTLRADGQWASEPLISNEQFGAGGVNNVRGYHEGEVFGDTGWHVGWEQKTPPVVLGNAYARHPLVVRGALYMDYSQVGLLDPQGRASHTSLWGTGFGWVATMGANWEARLLFSFPLLDAGTVQAGEPRFDFSLGAQF